MNKESEDIITLIDNDGNEMEFEVLDFIENEKGNFYALVPNFDLPDIKQTDEETYFIFKSNKSENDNEEQLEEVEDEKVLDELSVIFEKHFDEKYKMVN